MVVTFVHVATIKPRAQARSQMISRDDDTMGDMDVVVVE